MMRILRTWGFVPAGIILLISILGIASAQNAPRATPKPAALNGAWEANDGDATIRLVFRSSSILEFDGEAFPYVLTPKVIRVDEDGETVEYPYVLKGDVLTLTFEDGEKVVFHKAGRSAPVKQAASDVPAPTGTEHLLSGRFMSYSSASSSTGSSSWTTYVSFDGRGSFEWSSESAHSASSYDQTGAQTGSGLAYGSNNGNRGTYRVVGDRILVRFPDGSEGEAYVKERFADGSIGAFTYDGKTYAR